MHTDYACFADMIKPTPLSWKQMTIRQNFEGRSGVSVGETILLPSLTTQTVGVLSPAITETVGVLTETVGVNSAKRSYRSYRTDQTLLADGQGHPSPTAQDSDSEEEPTLDYLVNDEVVPHEQQVNVFAIPFGPSHGLTWTNRYEARNGIPLTSPEEFAALSTVSAVPDMLPESTNLSPQGISLSESDEDMPHGCYHFSCSILLGSSDNLLCEYCAQFDDVLTSIDHDSDGCPGCTPDEDWQENGNAITWTRWVEIVVIYLTDEQDFRQEQGTHLLEGLYVFQPPPASRPTMANDRLSKELSVQIHEQQMIVSTRSVRLW
jgi:hypothetical protein